MYTAETGLEFGEAEFGELGEFGEFGEAELGELGEFGELGELGEYGETGEYGEFGEYGETGEYGEFGEYGETGEYGEFGELGEFGEYGEQEAENEQFLGGILGSLLGGEVLSPLNEAQEVALANELLEISSEEELEQFLGKLFKRVAKGVGGIIKSPVGRALGGVLKSVAKKALPVVGGALGSMVAPGIGTAIGSKLGSMAGGLFEVELEGMSTEQAEFEVARRYVALSAAAARNAALARPRPGIPARTVANASVARAARTYAPGVYKRVMPAVRRGVPGARGLGARPITARPGYGRPIGRAGVRPGRYPARRPRPVPGRRPGIPSGRSRRGAGGYAPGSGGYGPAVGGYGPGVDYGPAGGFGPGVGYGPGIDYAPAPSPGFGWDGNGAGPVDTGYGTPDTYGGQTTSGRWIRRGRRIIVMGI